jgi:hypothetical protein
MNTSGATIPEQERQIAGIGDTIRTVTVAQTLETVGMLVVIVLLRSFLTLTLELENEGRWPWQQSRLKG